MGNLSLNASQLLVEDHLAAQASAVTEHISQLPPDARGHIFSGRLLDQMSNSGGKCQAILGFDAVEIIEEPGAGSEHTLPLALSFEQV